MDVVDLSLRVALSLACVLGLLWLSARGLRRTAVGRAGAAGVRVVGRQSLGQRSSVAVLQVGDRALLLGVTERSVSVLGEASLEDVGLLPSAPAERREPVTLVGASVPAAAAPVSLVAATSAAIAPAPSSVSSLGSAPLGQALVATGAPLGPALTAPARAAGRRAPREGGPLAGSALSPQTWSRALEVARDRTTRR
jgi:flagellar protein FliO/FliZ